MMTEIRYAATCNSLARHQQSEDECYHRLQPLKKDAADSSSPKLLQIPNLHSFTYHRNLLLTTQNCHSHGVHSLSRFHNCGINIHDVSEHQPNIFWQYSVSCRLSQMSRKLTKWFKRTWLDSHITTALLTMSSGYKDKMINTQPSAALGISILIPAKHELHPIFT